MNIGIITFQRAHNYGTVLQCYALQEVTKQLGHNATVIDYNQPFIKQLYTPSKFDQIRKEIFHPRALMGLSTKFKSQKIRRQIFDSFCSQYINMSEECDSNSIPNFDAYIVGSDQMWSIDCVGHIIDPVYFGKFARPDKSKLIGYAVSSNHYSINRLSSQLSELLNRFDAFSFREKAISQEVKAITSTDYPITIDPTLCADSRIWDKLIKDKWANRKYIAVYHILLRFSIVAHELILKQAHRIANEHGWEIIDLSYGDYSVDDFVSVIRHAQCVITSSFHATVFSIIFSKPLFAVKLHDGNDTRYVNLLQTLHLDNLLVDLDFTNNWPMEHDYNTASEILQTIRNQSVAFLKASVGDEKIN